MAIINEQHITNIENKIDSIQTPEQLTTYRDKVLQEFTDLQTQASNQIAELTPLATPPTTPDQAVTWITNLIGAQFTAPLANVTALQAEASVKYAALATKFSNRLAEIS